MKQLGRLLVGSLPEGRHDRHRGLPRGQQRRR